MCNLACIEIIMQLEDKQLEDEVLDNSELLVACYFIIESAVSYMAGGGGGHNSCSQVLDSKQRGQLYAALKNAFGTILKVSEHHSFLLSWPSKFASKLIYLKKNLKL